MEEGDDAAAAMAEAMGFSSFGAQGNPNKRRKFNPRADAVVASDFAIPHRDGAPPEAKTGSNATPLGVKSHNKDEIDLDDDDDEGLDASTSEVLGHLKDGQGNADGGDPESRYLDTSRPATVNAADEIQSKIDDIVGTGTPTQWPGIESSSSSSYGARRAGRVARGTREGYQVNQGRGRDPDRKWWVGYYDPSSNINPWEHLEQTKGLEPRGKWMSWEEAKG
ncbi:hypothetical protein F4818DRAFT_1907 [Hypoxylon cercidicola]|nr:hypothetical protein F4818DRAFT_1907 [Hypoxylon cercidicola]